jgi:hypothetical protein
MKEMLIVIKENQSRKKMLIGMKKTYSMKEHGNTSASWNRSAEGQLRERDKENQSLKQTDRLRFWTGRLWVKSVK